MKKYIGFPLAALLVVVGSVEAQQAVTQGVAAEVQAAAAQAAGQAVSDSASKVILATQEATTSAQQVADTSLEVSKAINDAQTEASALLVKLNLSSADLLSAQSSIKGIFSKLSSKHAGALKLAQQALIDASATALHAENVKQSADTIDTIQKAAVSLLETPTS